MKKNVLVYLAILTIVFFASCSPNNDGFMDESESVNLKEITTSFSEEDFEKSLNAVSNYISSTAKTKAVFNEEQAEKIIAPFIKDGKNIQEQLLDDPTLTLEQEDSLKNLNECQLVMLSVTAYSVINASSEIPQLSRAAFRYNKQLGCISEALVGGGGVTGLLTWGFLKKVGTRTFLRLSLGAFGGIVGGCITGAMYLNDYNICMNR